MSHKKKARKFKLKKGKMSAARRKFRRKRCQSKKLQSQTLSKRRTSLWQLRSPRLRQRKRKPTKMSARCFTRYLETSKNSRNYFFNLTVPPILNLSMTITKLPKGLCSIIMRHHRYICQLQRKSLSLF